MAEGWATLVWALVVGPDTLFEVGVSAGLDWPAEIWVLSTAAGGWEPEGPGTGEGAGSMGGVVAGAGGGEGVGSGTDGGEVRLAAGTK